VRLEWLMDLRWEGLRFTVFVGCLRLLLNY